MDRIDEKLLENVARFEESLGRMKSILEKTEWPITFKQNLI